MTTKERVILVSILLGTTGLCIIDVLFQPGVILPGPLYFVPIILAAYFLTPRPAAGVAAWTILLRLMSDLAKQTPSWLAILYFVALLVISFLSIQLSARMRREVALAADKEQLLTHIRLEAEHAKGTRNELRAVLASMTESVYIFDSQMQLISVNQAAAKALGYGTTEELAQAVSEGPKQFEVEYPGQTDTSVEKWPMWRARRGEEISNLEAKIRRRDTGQEWWVSCNSAPVRDDRGQVTAVVMTVRDITQQVQDRQEREVAIRRLEAIQTVSDVALANLGLNDLLRELLARLREVLTTDTAAVLLIDPAGKELTVRASLGIQEEEQRVVHVPVGEGIAGVIAASGKPMIVDDVSKIQAVGQFLREKVRSLLGVPLLVQGRVIGVVHVGTFQTRRFTEDDLQLLQLAADRMAMAIDNAQLYRQATFERARWETTVESMPDAVTVADTEGHVVYVNAAYARRIGYQIKPDLGMEYQPEYFQLYRPDGTLFDPEELPLQRAALTGEEVQGVEVVERTADGGEVVGLFNAAPLRDARGRVVGAVAVGRDITAQRQAEKRREEYVSMISHDLRQPITPILGMAEWLQRFLTGKGLEQGVRAAEAILTSAKRMNTMIQEMVEAARLESGTIGMHRETLLLGPLISDLAERVGTVEDRARIRLEALRQMPPVLADRERTERVLANLLSNALKYSPPDAEVFVQMKRSDGEAVVSVTDQGVGIAKADLAHIFDRYYRAEAGKQKADGLGLGLYIARIIVEAQGGRIWAESEPGRGSTFYFSLPLA